MTPDRYQQVKAICDALLDEPEAGRAGRIARLCSGDPPLEAEVRAVLAALPGEGFLDRPLAGRLDLHELLEVPAPSIEPGHLLADRFQIVRLLGRGGMGQVWQAFDSALNEAVAIKTLRPEVASDPNAVERFKQEAANARRVTHANICRVYDFFVHTGSPIPIPFLTMQLLEGETLQQRLARDGRIPAAETRRILEQCAQGLEAAHRAGLIHRDFKPGNVMLAPQGAVVMDFGIARQIPSPQTGTQTLGATAAGTPAYMAPEQIHGRNVTRTADIYAFAVVACEMLSGKRPAEGGLDEVGPNWEKALRKALDPDPRRRYASASALLDAAHPPARRNWIAGAAALLAAAAGLAYWRATPTPIQPSLAILPFESAGAEADQFKLGLTGELYSSLTRVKGLRVVAMESVLRLAGPDAAQTGLRASCLLTGVIARTAGRVRVNAQLVDPQSRTVLWAQSFERPQSEASTIHAGIAEGVIRSLGLAAAPGQLSVFGGRPPDPEAHRLYQQARALRLEGLKAREALAAFDQALGVDPQFALAWVGRADTLHALAQSGAMSAGEAIPKARESALRAIILDPNSAEALTVLGTIQSQGDWDLHNARLSLERALTLQPGSAQAHSAYGAVLTKMGRHEDAIRELKLARDLDPLSPGPLLNLGWMYFYGRRYSEALQTARQLERESPGYQLRCWLESHAQIGLGDKAGAAATIEACPERTRKMAIHPMVRAMILAHAGHAAEAREALDAGLRSPHGTSGKVWMAAAFAGLGEIDRAFRYLEDASAEREPLVPFVPFNRLYDPLRADPRFDRFLTGIGAAKAPGK